MNTPGCERIDAVLAAHLHRAAGHTMGGYQGRAVESGRRRPSSAAVSTIFFTLVGQRAAAR
jgi:hypothetical protein